jgi:MarR family 2-MHQ and catechol resistance regulon transcriptional repressor
MENRLVRNENSLSLLTWLRFARFYQRSNQLSNEYLQQFGISLAQFDTLAQIMIYEPITQMDLAKHLIITRGGVSRMLTRLENEELIVRKQNWKLKFISLTDKGRTLIEKVMPLQSDFQASMFDEVLDEEEMKQLHEMVKKIHKHSMQKKIIKSN